VALSVFFQNLVCFRQYLLQLGPGIVNQILRFLLLFLASLVKQGFLRFIERRGKLVVLLSERRVQGLLVNVVNFVRAVLLDFLVFIFGSSLYRTSHRRVFKHERWRLRLQVNYLLLWNRCALYQVFEAQVLWSDFIWGGSSSKYTCSLFQEGRSVTNYRASMCQSLMSYVPFRGREVHVGSRTRKRHRVLPQDLNGFGLSLACGL